jgi:two-component system, cell cycle sensor histidine kinase and response regulator CckA
MGDKVTQPDHAAYLRAKFLKAALESGAAPSLSHSVGDSKPDTSFTTPTAQGNWVRDPEVQKAYLEQLLEGAPEAITILDPQHRVTRINSEFSRLFGYSSHEALGQNIDALIVPEEGKEEFAAKRSMLERGETVSLEAKRRRKDGSLVDVAILGTPIHGVRGTVALYVVYRDISEQKRAEALNSALHRIAEKTSSSADLTNFYASIHSIVGELMYARNFYIALYDPPTQTLSFPYFADEEDLPPAPRKLGQGLTEYVLRKGEPLLATPEVFDDLVRRGEVSSIGAPSVDWLGVPLKTTNGCLGVVVVQSYKENIRFCERDKEILTFVSQQLARAIEHKRNELALRRSEARYRSLVESAVYGIYRSSLSGRFLDVNPALVSMLGYESAQKVLALSPQRDVFLDPEEQARLMRECKRKGRLDNFEIKWKRKDGTVITVRLSGRAVTAENESEETLEVIAEDITEKRVLEDQFRQAQKMEAVGRLAGGVAHDFNNLLMVISGYAEVMLEKLDPNGSLHHKASAIQQAADKATTLTRQLLAFSRKQLLELKVVDLNAIVSDIERLLAPLIGEKIQLVTRLAPSLGRTRADAGQLEQVIMNLVVNAKDAMPEGGSITIQTANTVLDDSYRQDRTYIQAGPYVMLSVSDTGCGMDKETQSRIFEPFFTTKEKGKGTGLGLSTVYGIVKQSGGYIFAHSEVGQGTTFRIYLPRVEEPAEPITAHLSSSVKAKGSETVLLVEDEDSVRGLVRETLEARGYTVLEASDGAAALRIAETFSGHIHLLISDVVMPGMSGKELAARLKKTREQTRVLFLSGYTEDAILQEGGLEPGAAFLQKPFTLQNLARKVRDVLQAEPR